MCPLPDTRASLFENTGHRAQPSLRPQDSCAWDFAWPWGVEVRPQMKPGQKRGEAGRWTGIGDPKRARFCMAEIWTGALPSSTTAGPPAPRSPRHGVGPCSVGSVTVGASGWQGSGRGSVGTPRGKPSPWSVWVTAPTWPDAGKSFARGQRDGLLASPLSDPGWWTAAGWL